jgi:hypothetical protein
VQQCPPKQAFYAIGDFHDVGLVPEKKPGVAGQSGKKAIARGDERHVEVRANKGIRDVVKAGPFRGSVIVVGREDCNAALDAAPANELKATRGGFLNTNGRA